MRKWRFPPNLVKLEHWTIHQLCNFISTFWGAYFQFSLALSRLVDVQIDTNVTQFNTKCGGKILKALHCFEYMVPQRANVESEYSENIKQIIQKEKEEAENPKAIEGEASTP